MSEKSFWQFSLAAYSVVGVDRLLLRLQDEFGADINMLLFCYWLGLDRKTPTPEYWLELQSLTDQWRKESILPLRALRRFLKQQPGVTDFRRNIQAMEVEAERLQQKMMEDFSASNGITAYNGDPVDASWHNLQTYFASLQTIDWLLVIDVNKELHQLMSLPR